MGRSKGLKFFYAVDTETDLVKSLRIKSTCADLVRI